MVDNYVENLRKLRETSGFESEGLRQLEKTYRPPTPTTQGLMRRPDSSVRLQQQQDVKRVETPESILTTYVQEMEQLRRKVKSHAQGDGVEVASTTKEQAAFRVVDEELGKKQESPKDWETILSKPPTTVGETVDRVAATAAMVNLAIPEDVKQDTAFLSEVKRVANKFEISENDLMALISFETGGTFDPSIRNKQEGQTATGLIQFVENTARGLGTSTAELAKMNRAQQMAYVEKYLGQYASKIKGGNRDDLYMAVIWPAAIGKPRDYVMFKEGSVQYQKNSGLDLNKDGAITKEEAARRAFS